jgi:hypothetical protein
MLTLLLIHRRWIHPVSMAILPVMEPVKRKGGFNLPIVVVHVGLSMLLASHTLTKQQWTSI